MAEGRNSDDPLDSPVPHGVGRRAGEVDVGGLGAVRPGIRRSQPEDGVGGREGFVQHVAVPVRALDHLDPLPDLRRELGGITSYHADPLIAADELVENLGSDVTGRCGDDDDGYLPWEGGGGDIAIIHDFLDKRYTMTGLLP